MVKLNESLPPGLGFRNAALGTEPVAETFETLGALVEFWGFPRALGRVWGLLYLSPAPLAASDIAAELGMTAGATTIALDELLLWNVIAPFGRPGDRRDYYQCDGDIWKFMARLLSDRELRQIETAYEAFAHAEQNLKLQSAEKDGDETAEFARERVAQLRRAAATGRTMLQNLILRK